MNIPSAIMNQFEELKEALELELSEYAYFNIGSIDWGWDDNKDGTFSVQADFVGNGPDRKFSLFFTLSDKDFKIRTGYENEDIEDFSSEKLWQELFWAALRQI